MEYQIIKTDVLKESKIRDIRDSVLLTLEDRIGATGYNPAKPLSVIKSKDGYIVADGAHRLSTIRKLGITEVPCVIYENDTDLYQLGVKCNQDEDTYAPMDLFDYLGVIQDLKGDNTQEEIGEKIGWSRDRIADHSSILNHVVAENLNLAKQHQEGRATSDVILRIINVNTYLPFGVELYVGEWFGSFLSVFFEVADGVLMGVKTWFLGALFIGLGYFGFKSDLF